MRKIVIYCVLLSVTQLLSSRVASGAIACVSTDNELFQALSVASARSEDDVVRIVQGTYSYNGGLVYTSANDSNLVIEGGYTESCVSRLADPTNTILDGAENYRSLSLSSTGSPDISINAITFQNGNGGSLSCGGGALIETNGGTISVTNSIFNDNLVPTGYGGGGLCIQPDGGNVLLTGNQFMDNHSNGIGTGVKISSAGVVSVSDNVFLRNQGSSGAGISLTGIQEATISDNTFTANYASRDDGSGIYAGVNRLVIDHNSVTGGTRGGGIYAGPSPAMSDRSWTISNNVILNNAEGPGIRVSSLRDQGELIIVNNVVAGNASYYPTYSGGISVEGLGDFSSVTLTNNTIVDNYSPGDGGGLKIANAGNDSAIYINSNIFWNNVAAGSGNDIFINDDYEGDSFNTLVEILGNDFDQSNQGFSIGTPPIVLLLDSSNIDDANPSFVAVTDNYRLNKTSPCVDKGNNLAPGLPLFDQEGAPRIIDGIVDMGAYETVPYGDVTLDGDVDLKDVIVGLTVLAGTRLEGVSSAGDVNQDGTVGMAEVLYGLEELAGGRLE